MTGRDLRGTLQHRVIAEAIRAGNPRTRYGPTLPGLLAQPGGDLVLHRPPQGHPPRRLSQRRPPQGRHPALPRRLERAQAPLRLGEDRRPGSTPLQPEAYFWTGALAAARAPGGVGYGSGRWRGGVPGSSSAQPRAAAAGGKRCCPARKFGMALGGAARGAHVTRLRPACLDVYMARSAAPSSRLRSVPSSG